MKRFLTILLLATVALVFWQHRQKLQEISYNLPEIKQSIQDGSLVNDIKEEIFTSTPLRGNLEERNSHLTVSGTISWTNSQRKLNGNLPALKENIRLNQAAQLKVEDMFAKQYFEHESPSGDGPGDLARAVNYQFIAIGENLALGNFKDDQALVEAWMNSPGHRANILNTKFTEIGVAVGKGTYEGKQVWLAVQEFGKPTSACPVINVNLKTSIKNLEAEVNNLEEELKALKAELDSSNPQTEEEYKAYNEKVVTYNMRVKIYNNRIDVLKQTTNEYNTQVRAFNACASQ